MPVPLPTATLVGEHVRLVPLAAEHVAGLVAAASVDRSTFDWTTVPDGPAAMERYVATLVAAHAAGEVLPFAQVAAGTGEPIGCTRFLEPRWWTGRDLPDEVEIGGTWLAPDAQRTPINTEAKLLLLSHAFETWQVVRVAIATDERDERSRRAIERLGARFEGILRHHRPSTAPGEEGRPRSTAMYRITDDEWPAVHVTLLERLAMPYGHG